MENQELEKKEENDKKSESLFEELSIIEVEDRLAFANAARCDISIV